MPSYELRLIEDNLRSGATLELPADAINRVIYVAHGGITVDGKSFGDDEAWQGRSKAIVATGEHGAALWRWELTETGSTPKHAAGSAGTSRLKLACPLVLPSAGLLMRADSVSFPSGGCAFLHTHQGPGIRCVIDGGIRIDTAGHSTCYAPGDAWFEAGPLPVFAQGAMDRPTRFVRCMILPAALKGKSSISYVRPEDRDKPKSQSYKGYVDTLIDIA
jgi:hypothetical protein